jgi:hypothetical protein
MDLNLLSERAVATMWRLAGAFVQACVYVVPAGFNPATGLTQASETRVSVQALIATLKPREWDLVVTQPGDERVLIRAKELGAVVPVAGDYLIGDDGVQRDVRSTRKVAAGLVWLLYCSPERSEDWGDLSAATVTEDRGDLAAATTSEDWGLVA